jgi:hypothetical protein
MKKEFNKVSCCICYREKNIDETLMPSSCKMKYGNKCHRICQDCWWNSENGFGRETSIHTCPGCEKRIPLTIIELQETILIDLTNDI